MSSIFTVKSFILGYIKYYGDKAGLVAAIYVRLGAAYHQLKQLDQAHHCLEKADQIYRVIPGKMSSFYKKDYRPVYDKLVNS